MYKDPDEHLPRLVSLWKQIARHYRGYPNRLYFELLNEPCDQLTDGRWQAVFPKLLRAVRETNPTRMVIVGPAYWNGFSHLEQLRLPEEDRRLIATFHYYSPFHFTHQGVSWVSGSDAWKGTTKKALRRSARHWRRTLTRRLRGPERIGGRCTSGSSTAISGQT
jgi:aryl-phospho-beta-D-glucosidase BglC (GH1 family)